MNKKLIVNVYNNYNNSYSYNNNNTIYNKHCEIIVNTLINSIFKNLYYKVINNDTIDYTYNNAIIGSIKFIYSSNNVIVYIPYYISNDTIDFNISKTISSTISQVFGNHLNTKIIIQKINYPYIDSKIIAKYIILNTTIGNFLSIKKIIIQHINIYYNKLPANINGIKIIINGRLTTEKVIPRKTSKSFIIGSITNPIITNKIFHIDYAKVTHKNKLGQYTIKV